MTYQEAAHPQAARILARGYALIGTAFQAQGRLPGVGLDCVGVICAAAQAADILVSAPADYSLTSPQSRDLETPLAALGCVRRVHAPCPADIVVMQGPAGRQHLGLWTGADIIHAHIGLRRVVCAPPHPDWPILSSWCLPQE